MNVRSRELFQRLKLKQDITTIILPRIIIAKCGDKVDVSNYTASSTICVNVLTEDGSVGETIKRTFNISKNSDKWYLNKERSIQLPNKHDKYIIKYEETTSDGYLPGRLTYEYDYAYLKNKPFRCPANGSFIGYKIARTYEEDDSVLPNGDFLIIKLKIPEDAKRSSVSPAYGAKCRCDKAKVMDIFDINNKSKKYCEARSLYDYNFSYKVGETVSVNNFCDDRFKECAPGIHFFMSSFEAMAYLILS